jgi:beta-lactamase class A
MITLRHLVRFAGLALLLFPSIATASQFQPSQQQSNNTKLAPLPPLPNIRFVAPTIQNNPININPAPATNGEMRLGKQILPLNSQIRALMSRYSYLSPGMFFVDLQTGDYIDINGDKVFSAASTIKLPILITLFQEI